jgi:hypothetical protein
MLRMPHYLDNERTDGGELIGLTHVSWSTLQNPPPPLVGELSANLWGYSVSSG